MRRIIFSSVACLAVPYFSKFLILRKMSAVVSQTYIGLHKNIRCSSQILMNLEFSRKIFEKYSNNKFRENLSSESRIVACGRTDGRTDGRTKLIVSFRNLAKAPKNSLPIWQEIIFSSITKKSLLIPFTKMKQFSVRIVQNQYIHAVEKCRVLNI
jgi:hypothetical protein